MNESSNSTKPTPLPSPLLPIAQSNTSDNLQAVDGAAARSSLWQVATLSEAETAELQKYEDAIGKGLRAELAVGVALLNIREKQLYRAGFNSFDDYYKLRWAFKPPRVYSLIAAAQVFLWISELKDVPQPEYESQLRPLFGLGPDQAQLAWQCAVGSSEGKPITAKLVLSAVKDLQYKQGKEEPCSTRVPKSALRPLVRESMRQLLTLLNQRAAYEQLVEKAETLHFQLEQLLAPARKKKKP